MGVVILNYENWNDTIECLDSVFKSNISNFIVTVVDNCSKNNSIEHIKRWSMGRQCIVLDKIDIKILKKISEDISKGRSNEKIADKSIHNKNTKLSGDLEVTWKTILPNGTIIIIKNEKNTGYAGGNNIGIMFSLLQECEYVLVLNNDTIIEPFTINHMIECAKRYKAEIVGALIKNTKYEIEFAGDRFPRMLFLSAPKIKYIRAPCYLTDRIEGSGVLFSREFIKKRIKELGYFLDENLFMYCEELELALWCRKNNIKMVIAKNGILYHKRGASLGTNKKQKQMYFITRNRIIVAKKYFSTLVYILFMIFYCILSLLKMIKYILINDFNTSKAIKKGVFDALKYKEEELINLHNI